MRDETGTPEDSSAAMTTNAPPWHVLSVKVISQGKSKWFSTTAFMASQT